MPFMRLLGATAFLGLAGEVSAQVQEQRLVSSWFANGTRVALSGDTLVVSAVSGNLQFGHAHFFGRSPNGWNHQTTLDFSGPFFDYNSVDIDGDTAVG